MKHEDYITHIKNKEDQSYLKGVHFPVNMRLMKSSELYKEIVLQQCNYIRFLALSTKEGYKKPHGMSSANAGLSFNIIGIVRDRNTPEEYCQIMINPVIVKRSKDKVLTKSNCGSLTLKNPIDVKRHSSVTVEWYDETGKSHRQEFNRNQGGFTIQHEIDHNNGILISDLKG